MEVEPAVLCEAGEDADSLVSSNDPDDMANEQTWPTEEEMQGSGPAVTESALPDAKQGTTPKVVRRIPKGMSEYQASWIIDEDEDDGDEKGSEDEMVDDAGDDDEEEEEEMQDMPVEEDHEMETDSRRSVAFQDLDNEEEAKQYGYNNSWKRH
jgi:pre-rRNA-processing protein TSR1